MSQFWIGCHLEKESSPLRSRWRSAKASSESDSAQQTIEWLSKTSSKIRMPTGTEKYDSRAWEAKVTTTFPGNRQICQNCYWLRKTGWKQLLAEDGRLAGALTSSLGTTIALTWMQINSILFYRQFKGECKKTHPFKFRIKPTIFIFPKTFIVQFDSHFSFASLWLRFSFAKSSSLMNEFFEKTDEDKWQES